MSTPENDTNFDDQMDDSVLDSILDNEEISQLPFGSAEQKAALAKVSKTANDTSAGDEKEQPLDDEEESDDESEDDESDDTKEEDEAPRKQKKGIQKRFDEMTKKIAELESQLNTGKKDKSEVEEPAKSNKPGAHPDAPEAPQYDEREPTPNDFDNLVDFYSAQGKWLHAKAEFDRQVVAIQQEHEQNVQTLAKTWDDRVTAVKEDVDDFDEVVNMKSVNGLNAMQPALQFLFKQEMGPLIGYNLLQDEELAAKFKKADAAEQVEMLIDLKREISPAKNSQSTVTSAPPPARTVPKSSAKNKAVAKDDMSEAELDRLLERETNGRYKAKR